MSLQEFGTVTLIANPAAQAGRAASAVRHVEAALRASLGDSLNIVNTAYAGHAVQLVRGLPDDVGTVIALGGDGVVHEVANGLMARPAGKRPALGVIPFGSGNDYAESLGMPMKLGTAARQVLSAKRTQADIGCVNGEYFVETLSFGLDAAIAMATNDLRRKTGRTGTMLYAQAGVDQLLNHRVAMGYRATLLGADGGDSGELSLDGQAFLFAVQIGPTYGGHFKICPKAKIDDGLFDVCIAHPPLSAASALGLFGLAKNGWHTGSKKIECHTARGLVLEFDQPPATQVDGEPLSGSRFEVSIEERALTVLKV